MSTCPMPDCHQPANCVNREGQSVCADHETVVVGTSFVDDKRRRDGGHG